jgi:hypothetical protein
MIGFTARSDDYDTETTCDRCLKAFAAADLTDERGRKLCAECVADAPPISQGKLGTEWCAPGSGAHVGELGAAARSYEVAHRLGACAADIAIVKLSRHHAGFRTNLRLTGRPIQDYDLRRIADCEVAR